MQGQISDAIMTALGYWSSEIMIWKKYDESELNPKYLFWISLFNDLVVKWIGFSDFHVLILAVIWVFVKGEYGQDNAHDKACNKYQEQDTYYCEKLLAGQDCETYLLIDLNDGKLAIIV